VLDGRNRANRATTTAPVRRGVDSRTSSPSDHRQGGNQVERRRRRRRQRGVRKDKMQQIGHGPLRYR
jgi:hypothetical protein